jgi:LAO/AO transport system kinase
MLVESLLKKDKRAAARLITLIEDDRAGPEVLRKLHENSMKSHIVGITGPPGTGKSTLISSLTKECRKRGKLVGILAVDPSSPFTGGAVLGDRIRMNELTMDEGVFIRSFATRGHSGGLSKAVLGAAKVLDAYGMDIIFLETVGTGQDEVEIYNIALTNVLVESPGLGDGIQIMKAGILEIADIFVVNKADREGAEGLISDLEEMIEFDEKKWRPRIVRTIAVEDKGIEELMTAIEEHHDYLKESGELETKKRRRVEFEISELLSMELRKRLRLSTGVEYSKLLDEVVSKKLDPHSAAKTLFEQLSEK